MKIIVFDLGGVILKNKSVSILNKLDLTKEEYEELSKFFNNFKLLDLGQMTLEEKFDNLDISKYLKEKYQDFLLHYYKYREINYELIDLIKKLKNNNNIICILSDNNYQAFNYYKKQDYFSNIDIWMASYEYQTVKKDKELFKIFLNKYNFKANNCFFIDDREVNIEIASNLGFKTFLYKDDTSNNELIKELKKFKAL